MSNLGKKVLLYRTDISGKTPNISDVAIGELALNYNANSPFLAFKDTNNELQKIGALSNNIGDSEFVTMSQKAITEAIELNPHGGYIYIEKFDRENFQNALKLALQSLSEGEDAILDCTYFKGTHTITEGFQINNPVKLIFGGIDVTYNNVIDTNLFTFNCNNISIEGLNRNTDKTQLNNGSTIFRMINSDSTLNGYHIKSRGNKNIEIKNITLVGKRTTLGHQYGNTSYPIDGVGGIYIEKSKPEVIEASNTCNNTRIENVLIAGSKSHGIYIDTPILSTFKNIRLSDCGGHGIFINNGTSILLENVYSSSANMAGFCIYSASYVSLNNCVSENSGIGFWIRSAFNVTLMNPGVEETNTYGKNPWRLSQPISGKYGLGLTTLHSNGVDIVNISDVNSDYYEYFIGYGILISGGKSINIFTPYIKSIGNSIVTEAYSGGTELSSSLKYINVVGNTRAVYILNPSFKEKSDSLVPTTIKHEIGINNEVENIELIYDTTSTLLQGTLDSTTYVSNSDLRAPIYCKTTSCVIRNGKNLITNYHYSTLPTESSELTNKEYVDSLVDDIIAGENANLENYYTKTETYNKEEVNTLVNNLDVEHKLSETYESVTYPTINNNSVEFIAAKANENLDVVVKHLDQNISTLVQEVLNDEEVTAAAITEIKESVGLNENLKYVVNTGATYISGATSLSEADNLLDAAIKNVISEIPSLDDYATKEYVTNEFNNLISGAPETLDTLNELASALNNDSNFATTITTEIGKKASKEYVDEALKTIKHQLSETYESVTYPTVEETDGIEFVAAKANDDLDTVVSNLDRNVSTLIQEVLKDEIAVAQMISNHNESCGFNESGQYVKYTEGSVINKSKNTSEALIALDNAISNMNVVLSDNYKSVIYPEDCGDKTFTPAVKGQNLDEAIKTVETNIATLVQTVLENEEIGTRSLVKHNISCGFDVNGNYIPYENGTIIGNSTNISDALIALDVSYSNILESVPSIEEINNLINNLDIEHKLSETYESVAYPTVEETDGVEFIAAKANENLDIVVKHLDQNISTLIQEVLNDEEVTAAAITEIKESVGLDENLKYVVNTRATYISGATSLSEADNLLDAAIKNVISEIPSLDDYATKEYVTSQLGNVDLSEINEQLEEANNKISLLEAQLSAATSTISTLESKLNAIIIAVGLNSDGTFIVPTTAQTSGYTTAATSVMSAIHLMDNQIEENETVSAYALTDLNNRLNEYEKVNATALTDLNERLNEEINRVNEYEEVNATALTDLNERITTLEIS